MDSQCSEPYFLFNYTVDEDLANWKAVETMLWPPSCIPEELQGGIDGRMVASFHQVTGYSGLVHAAVKAAGFMVARVLQKIRKLLGCQMPGRGSGKKGGFTKPDYAKALVNHLFGDDTEKEKARMVNGHLVLEEDVSCVTFQQRALLTAVLHLIRESQST